MKGHAMKKLMLIAACSALSAAYAQTVVQPMYMKMADGSMQQVILQPDGTYVPVVQQTVVQPQVVVQQGLTLPNGTVMPVGAKVCPKCDGTGVKEHFWYSEKCPNCRGYGYKLPQDNGPDVIFIHDRDRPPPYYGRHHDRHHESHHHDKHHHDKTPMANDLRFAKKVQPPAPKPAVKHPAPAPKPVAKPHAPAPKKPSTPPPPKNGGKKK
jgi:Zn-finger nucleic acid-binding protein